MSLRDRLSEAVSGVNPFLGTPATDPGPSGPAVAADLGEGGRLYVRGPAIPVGCAPLTEPPVLGRASMPPDTAVAIAGCHGGAGASSLVTALSPHFDAFDMGQSWPQPQPDNESEPIVLLVARTTGHGLDAAHNAVREWGSRAVPWVRLAGLVLVADAPHPHPDLRDRIETVASTAPHGWFLPWQEQWRPLPVTERPMSRLGLGRRIVTSIANKIKDLSSDSQPANQTGQHERTHQR